MNFTDETIKAELAVCEAATERPWEVIDGHIPQIEAVNKKRGVRPAGCPYPRIARMAAGYAPDERNAELVVHACNNYEAALKELLVLRRALTKPMRRIYQYAPFQLSDERVEEEVERAIAKTRKELEVSGD